MKFNQIYQYVDEKIGGAFAKYGRFVSRHAWKIIIIAIIVNGGLAVGIVNLKSDIEAANVYLPRGTRSRDDLDTMDSTFPDLSGSNFNSLQDTVLLGLYARVVVSAKSGPLLSRSVLEKVGQLDNLIQGITATSDTGETITFDSICSRAYGTCSVGGSIFWSSEFLTAVDSSTASYPTFTLSSAGTVSYSSELGGTVQLDSTGQYLESIQYIHIKYNFRTDGDTSMADNWVDAFKERLNGFSSSDIDIAYGHYNSLDEELDSVLSGDIILFVVTIILMMTYAGVATLTSRITDQVSQRVLLGFAGLLAAGLAIVASFGLCAAAGVDYVSIVGVVPFLVIGIGIDDMFIMLSGLSGAQVKLTVEDKMAETFRASGVGITITSLTDFIAFMAGAGSTFLAVQNFCIYTGVAVMFCYINNVTFFAACIALNERRVAGNRHFFTCRPIKLKDDLRAEGKSNRYVMCCGGSPPRNRNEAESLLDKFPRWLIPKIVLKLPCKIVIIILFMGYLAAAIYGCVHMKQGLLFTQLVPDDSYFHKYSELVQDNFKRATPVSFVTTKTYMYSDHTTKTLLDRLVSNAHSNNYFDSNFEVNWLSTYMASSFYDGSSETNFITGLLSFVNDSAYRQFENDIVVDSSGTKITASRIHLLSRNLKDSQEEGKFMLESRDIADSAQFECFAFSASFVAYEQYVSILGQTLQSVGIALAAVFVITCIFMPHPILIIFVTVAVLMIMLGVFGFIIYLDVALSAITMIHLIMSVGFSIDFTAHICHGYMTSDGETRAIRVQQAIDKTGAPIFHGAVSSLIGILILIAAKSYIFRTFGGVMAFVLVFGIAHALLLLPVMLSWIGPGRDISVDKDDGKSNNKNGSFKSNGHSNGAGVFDDEMKRDKEHTASSNSKVDKGKKIDKNTMNSGQSSDVLNFHQLSSQYDLNNQSGDRWMWKEVQI